MFLLASVASCSVTHAPLKRVWLWLLRILGPDGCRQHGAFSSPGCTDTALSASPCAMGAIALTTSVALCWASSSMSTPFLHWGAQLWTDIAPDVVSQVAYKAKGSPPWTHCWWSLPCRVHCWPIVNLLSTRIPRAFSAELLCRGLFPILCLCTRLSHSECRTCSCFC